MTKQEIKELKQLAFDCRMLCAEVGRTLLDLWMRLFQIEGKLNKKK